MYVANNLSIIVHLLCNDSIADSTIHNYYHGVLILCIIYAYKIRF